MNVRQRWAAHALCLLLSAGVAADKKASMAALEKLKATITPERQSDQVTEVRLHGADVTDAALAAVKLDDFQSLESLSLTATRVTDKGLAGLLRIADAPGNRLKVTSLRLSDNSQLTNSALAILKHLPRLERLDLSSSKLTGKELSKLREIKSLNWLGLSSNPMITDVSIIELNAMPNIKSADLNGTNVTIDGLLKLVNLKNSTRWNFFGWDVITDDGLSKLRSGGFLDNTNFLNVAFTKITDGGMPSLNGLKKLNTLVLTRTKVSDRGMKMITDLPALSLLFVDFTRVTEEGEKELKKNLPQGVRITR
jgi:internalin A